MGSTWGKIYYKRNERSEAEYFLKSNRFISDPDIHFEHNLLLNVFNVFYNLANVIDILFKVCNMPLCRFLLCHILSNSYKFLAHTLEVQWFNPMKSTVWTICKVKITWSHVCNCQMFVDNSVHSTLCTI